MPLYEAFTSQNAVVVSVADSLVLSEKIADFATADTDVTCGNINMRTDMTIKFGHKRLTEFHNFVVGFAFRIEVRAAFATANRKPRQGIFENLLKSQELQNTEVDTGMETQTAFVRSDRGIHLHAIPAIDVSDIVIVLPSHAESYDTLRFDNAFKKFAFFVLRIFLENRNNRRQNFLNRVLKLRLIGIPLFNQIKNIVYILLHIGHKKNLLVFRDRKNFSRKNI